MRKSRGLMVVNIGELDFFFFFFCMEMIIFLLLFGLILAEVLMTNIMLVMDLSFAAT